MLAGAFVLLLLIPSPAAAFFNVSLDVVVLVDKPSYRAGDVVNASVYVIWGGTLSDAAFVDLEFSVNTYPSWTESVPLIRESAGSYRGSFPILANMTSVPWSDLRSDVSVGSLTSSGYALVFLARSPVLTDRAFLSTYEAAPGQTVNGTLQTYLDGALADVDKLTITATLSVLGYPYVGSELAVRNVSAGTYGFSYTVPSDLNLSGSVQFYASAQVSAILTTFGLSNLPTLRVDVADPFLIWTHQVALDSAHAAFDVWVADPSGTPVAGAGVWTVVDRGSPLLGGVASARAQTDSAGRASFDFPFLPALLPQFLSYYGYVTIGSANESFTGYFAARAVSLYGFAIQRDNPQELFEPGEHAVLRYTARFNGSPYAGSVILYAVNNDSSLLAYGRATTDASGSFALNFTMPWDGASIEFATQAPDGTNTGASLLVLACRRMNVQVGALQVGTTGHLIAELPATGGPWSVDFEFYPSNTSAPPDVNGGWQVQDELTGLGVRLGSQTVAGGTVNLSLPLPSFLPAGSYYLSIVAYPLNAVAPFAAATFPLRYAYAALVTVQGPPLGAVLLVLVTLPIVLAVGVAAWVVERRRRRQPPPRRTEPQPPPPSP